MPNVEKYQAMQLYRLETLSGKKNALSFTHDPNLPPFNFSCFTKRADQCIISH